MFTTLTLLVGRVSVVQPLNYPVSSVGLDDLRVLYNELLPVSHLWYSLGIQLQIPIETLKRIRIETEMNKCLLEMLTVWLQSTDPSPTWSILIEALDCPAVEERLLAQQLRDKYYPRNEGWVTPSYPIQRPAGPSTPQGN